MISRLFNRRNFNSECFIQSLLYEVGEQSFPFLHRLTCGLGSFLIFHLLEEKQNHSLDLLTTPHICESIFPHKIMKEKEKDDEFSA